MPTSEERTGQREVTPSIFLDKDIATDAGLYRELNISRILSPIEWMTQSGIFRGLFKRLDDTLINLQTCFQRSLNKMSENMSEMNHEISGLTRCIHELTGGISQLSPIISGHFENQQQSGSPDGRFDTNRGGFSGDLNENHRISTEIHSRSFTNQHIPQSRNANTRAHDESIPVVNSQSNACNKVASIKISPFTGSERWDIWKKMFDRTAVVQGWTENEKLAQLLPRIQGSAGDFVHGQLSDDVANSYERLVQELESRYRVIETPKMFGAQFSNRRQKLNESVFEYAAELKRLYDKAHSNRDVQTRNEDLLRRFLDGLNDDEARFAVEFSKDPETIDQAVNQVINFQEAKRCVENRENNKANANNKGKKNKVAWAELDDSSDDEKAENLRNKKPRVRRNQNRPSKLVANSQSSGQRAITPTSSGDSENSLLKELSAKLENIEKSLQLSNKSDTGTSLRRVPYNKGNHGFRKEVICFKCNEKGHYARECGNATQNGSQINFDARRDNDFKAIPFTTARYSQNRPYQTPMNVPGNLGSALNPFDTANQSVNAQGTEATNSQGHLNLQRPNSMAGMRSSRKFSGQANAELDQNEKNTNGSQGHANVRRKVPKSDGVYVEGTVEGIKIIFTADTGSSITIVSEITYNKIPEQYKPKLVPSSTVANANGIPLQELGRAMFNLTIGDLSIYKELLVAKIEDEGLLGVDILQNRKGGAADILLSQGLIRLQGVDIPCV
ncbi:hypothetical protein FSP39_018253 [Pinctada imbricata]|uniref:CCHC-type domain-containing protein n=1 Tax=Pinctada imbricata TaxID=66713 RepID=A0AA89BV10_PINIB|nr:hypothetical protein FSP39_018253 [Pinctada imbricata]